ncbi:MAG TPA: 23S rRNA (guanosine(2251)-2'-O)-methyltransferase RlmB [Acidimicrobiales bacterium]|nr:23S rRNA (guanosine(2251)-2'-O)-methyltransferase RlmB [Acidimicrobiales bacterium]
MPGRGAARHHVNGGAGRRRGHAPPADRPRPVRRRAPDRSDLGGDQVEGRQAVRELLAAGKRPVREVWISEGLDPSPQIDDIERLAVRRRVRVLSVPRRKLEMAARTDSAQGVLARAQPLDEADLDDLCRTTPGGAPFLVVLDGVTDPHNLGALLRTAEAAGVTGVVVPRHRAAHVTPTVAKVAAGAIEHLPIAVVPGIPNALRRMDALGVTSVGLVTDAPVSLYELGPEVLGPAALVLGAEGKGLASLTRRRCQVAATIPQFGVLDSLNVAAAGAVACFELARRRAAGA